MTMPAPPREFEDRKVTLQRGTPAFEAVYALISTIGGDPDTTTAVHLEAGGVGVEVTLTEWVR